jgi:hypothetical protein
MRTGTRTVIGLAAVVSVAVPAIPAALADVSTCGRDTSERCIVLQQNSSGNLRAVGSLDDRRGANPVAVVAYLQRQNASAWGTVEASPRVEAAGYVLTATRWHKCTPAVYRAKLNWNYADGARTGTAYTTPAKVKC